MGVGLFRRISFMGKSGNLPGEEAQYQAYRQALDGMQGLPVTIRTIDVGADKPLDKGHKDSYLNPALGCAPSAGAWPTRPCSAPSCARCCARRRMARSSCCFPCWRMCRNHPDAGPGGSGPCRAGCAWRGLRPCATGAMIEIPAAALMVRTFLKYFDFLSIGTNDLIQYTLAIDRADEVRGPPVRPAAPHRAAAGGRRDCRRPRAGARWCRCVARRRAM